MNAKTLTIIASTLAAAVALVIAVIAVGAVPLGADGPTISNSTYAQRTAAADKLETRIQELATDVPPALPDVPERLGESAVIDAPVSGGSGGGGTTAAVPAPDAQVAPADDGRDDDWHDDDGDDDDDRGGDHEDD